MTVLDDVIANLHLQAASESYIDQGRERHNPHLCDESMRFGMITLLVMTSKSSTGKREHMFAQRITEHLACIPAAKRLQSEFPDLGARCQRKHVKNESEHAIWRSDELLHETYQFLCEVGAGIEGPKLLATPQSLRVQLARCAMLRWGLSHIATCCIA